MGRELRQFNMVPKEGETGADTWGGSLWNTIGGGGTWSHFALDPSAAELFVLVSNPIPDFIPAERAGDNKCLSSIAEFECYLRLRPERITFLELACTPG